MAAPDLAEHVDRNLAAPYRHLDRSGNELELDAKQPRIQVSARFARNLGLTYNQVTDLNTATTQAIHDYNMSLQHQKKFENCGIEVRTTRRKNTLNPKNMMVSFGTNMQITWIFPKRSLPYWNHQVCRYIMESHTSQPPCLACQMMTIVY